MAKKYTGKLAERDRNLPPDKPGLLAGTAALLQKEVGYASDEANQQYQAELQEWALARIKRELDGLQLLYDHYKIDKSQEPTANLLELVLALSRDHVPYFHWPKQGPGRRATSAGAYPIVADIANRAHELGLTKDAVFALFAEKMGLNPKTIEREVDRHNATQKNQPGE